MPHLTSLKRNRFHVVKDMLGDRLETLGYVLKLPGLAEVELSFLPRVILEDADDGLAPVVSLFNCPHRERIMRERRLVGGRGAWVGRTLEAAEGTSKDSLAQEEQEDLRLAHPFFHPFRRQILSLIVIPGFPALALKELKEGVTLVACIGLEMAEKYVPGSKRTVTHATSEAKTRDEWPGPTTSCPLEAAFQSFRTRLQGAPVPRAGPRP